MDSKTGDRGRLKESKPSPLEKLMAGFYASELERADLSEHELNTITRELTSLYNLYQHIKDFIGESNPEEAKRGILDRIRPLQAKVNDHALRLGLPLLDDDWQPVLPRR